MTFVNRQVLTDSQWMSFMECKEFSVEKGNANDEWIQLVCCHKKCSRTRKGGQEEKLIIVGLSWA